MKVFSQYDDYGYEEERLYTVQLTEEEVALYSYYLEQKEYVSTRKAKKLAKKALEEEGKFKKTIEAGGDAKAAQEVYDKATRKIMDQKDARKVLTRNADSTLTINAIKNDRAAEQIAGAIGNGDQELKQQISQQLKKSKGGKGVNVSKHIAAGKYDPNGVKQNVVNTANSNKVARNERNSARKQINDLNRKLQNQQLEAEAKARSLKKQYERELKNQQNRVIRTESRKQPVPDNKPKTTTPVRPATTQTPTTPVTTQTPPKTPTTPAKTQNVAASGAKNGKAMEFLKKNKKALMIGGGLAAAGGIGYGIYKHRQNNKE